MIPFIASNYRRDKIWLRRTKPSKREYQAESRSASFSILINGYQCQDLTGNKIWDAIDGRQRRGKTVIEKPGPLAKDRAQLELTGLGTLGGPRGALLAREISKACFFRLLWPSTTRGACSGLVSAGCQGKFCHRQVPEFCGKCQYPAV